MHVNNMHLAFPHELFIDGRFVPSDTGRQYDTINPNDESVICQVSKGSKADVNVAVMAAHVRF